MSRALAFLLAGVIALSSEQPQAQNLVSETERLAALARVWGLVKYYYPFTPNIRVDWDAVLTFEIPRVRAASDPAGLNEEFQRVIASAGATPRTPSGIDLEQAETDPAFQWIDDTRVFTTSAARRR
jgi:carboxyl-terminal processing protease